MKLIHIISFLFLFNTVAYCQQDFLIFKKGKEVISRYWKGNTIAFQLKNKQWQKGAITSIQNDSFYVRPMIVRYSLMGSDTFYLNIEGYALTDVFAMPKKGIHIDHKNGSFQISRSGGHVHWYWVKSGLIFKIGAAGYAGLNIANGLIKKDFSFNENKTQLITAATIFLGGMILHKTYHPYLKLGKKYHLEIFKLSK